MTGDMMSRRKVQRERRLRGRPGPWQWACFCCVFTALTSAVEQEEVDATPWVVEPVAEDLSHRPLVFWAAVAVHAFGVLLVAVSLCTWAHNKVFTIPVVLVGAVWFTAFDWALPLAELGIFNMRWLFRVEPHGDFLDECSEMTHCQSLDAARAAGPNVLVCAAALCAPPAEFLAAVGDCRLPYGIVPNVLEQEREVYVRVQGGDGSGGPRSAIKTRLAKSATAMYDWDWRMSSTLSTLLDNKQTLIRSLRSQGSMGWTTSQRESHYEDIRYVNAKIVEAREQRLEEFDSRCIVLPRRPTRVQMDAYVFDRWGPDQHMGQIVMPSVQSWTQAANCGNFGQRGTEVIQGGPHTLASCQTKCSSTTGCHTFYHGVEEGSEPGQCVLEIGNTGWTCLLLPSNRDYLSYSMGTVGAAPMLDQWLTLAPRGSDTSTRCSRAPCVRVTVYDELWAQFKIYDVDSSGLIGAAELRDMLLSLPAMNYFSNPDGIMGVTGEEELHNPQALEQLASTVQQLLDDHDGDRDGGISVDELETLWAARLRAETPAYLGNHPLRTGDAFLSVCAGFGVLVVGLMLGGWGNPEHD